MITQEELKDKYVYNPDTGLFIRNKRLGKYKKGTVAGWTHEEGYIKIQIGKKIYSAHRLAWLYIYGYIPEQIDHINHITGDNRLCNLREATYSINNKNTSKRVDNTSGQVGVCWNKKLCKWSAGIMVDKKRIHLGTFAEYHEAVNVRKNAEVLYGFHENHGKDL